MSLSAALARIAAAQRGSGSTATTRPSGPTMRAATSAMKPMFAPTSQTRSPARAERTSACWTAISCVPVSTG